MGGKQSKIDEATLNQFASRTFFTVKEIEQMFDRFESLGGTMTCVVPATIISRIPELKHNPFRFRICEVFGHRIASGVESNAKTYKIDAKKPNPATIKAIKDKYYVEIEEWYFNFPNFVTMMNAFSPRSTAPVKAYYAFLLYDYNGDKFIDTEDITKGLNTMVGQGQLSREKILNIAGQLLDEGDLDGNRRLSRTEFNRVIKRVPDFVAKFQFDLHM